jgi:hypothetical protein
VEQALEVDEAVHGDQASVVVGTRSDTESSFSARTLPHWTPMPRHGARLPHADAFHRAPAAPVTAEARWSSAAETVPSLSPSAASP